MSDVCFTHGSPEGSVSGLFAPTDEESYRAILRASAWPVLINGHSHEPSAYRQLDGAIENLRVETDTPLSLEAGARYVLTCGALEDSYCALFDLEARRFEVISL